MSELLGALMMSGWGVVIVSFFVLTWLIPAMALVATLNIRSIRIQLERINNTLEARPGAAD